MHKIFRTEKSRPRSPTIRSYRKSAQLTIHPIHTCTAEGRAEVIVNRGRDEREREKRKRGVHLCTECIENASDTPASLPSLREPPPQPGPPAIISFLFIQHIVSGLRVVRRLHSSSLIFTRGRPVDQPWFTSVPKYVSQNVVQPPLCSASKGGFHCNFHFYIAGCASRRRDASAHPHSYIFPSFFGRNVRTVSVYYPDDMDLSYN